MALRDFIKPRLQDWMMGFMDEMRPETVGRAEGEVLEVGFGTGRNLSLYPAAVKSVTGLDPLVTEGIAAVDARVAAAPFPVIRTALPADGALPFDAGRFDCVVTTWTLCSIPDPAAALREMRRVLKPGGRLLVLEFSRVWKPLTRAYDWYSFKVLPWLGSKFAGDADSYRYLAESIRVHPDQEQLKTLMEQAGLERVEYYNLSAGVVALHRAYKF